LVPFEPRGLFGNNVGNGVTVFPCPATGRFAMTFFRPFVALATALLCACVPAGKELSTSNSTVALDTAGQTQVARGLSFVEAQCSGCHAVRPGVTPPNSQAPSFVAVANDVGFNQDTLREFFRDGHDTPAAMSIKLAEDEAEMAAAYIMSLRSPR
jgi:mono/diheme cytochrome c family protein